jgi:hypothetical protein
VLPFGITAFEFSIVTFVAAFVGVALVIFASKYVPARYLAAFAVGVYLWYFTDTLGDANYLDVVNGPVLSAPLIGLVVLFVVGVAVFLSLDGRIFVPGGETAKFGLTIALLAAVAMGLHGLGEGADFGYSASQTSFNSLLDAFGGLQAGESWVLHKMMEPTVAAACYVLYADPKAKKALEKGIDSLAIAAAFVVPAVIGAIAGYYTVFDHTYIFALGLGTSIYGISRVAKGLYLGQPVAGLSFRMAISIAFGFLCLYLAAILHS